MLYFIEYLRAIATMLIANSHFKGVYPADFISFGGGLGLALFYMISGYLLWNISSTTRFLNWYAKKAIRLYIPLVLYKIVLLVVGYLNITNISDFIKAFVFPGTWFGASILLLYIVYFCFMKYLYIKIGNLAIYSMQLICILAFLALFFTRAKIGMFSFENLTMQNDVSVETPYLISQFIWLFSMVSGLWIKKNPQKLESIKSKMWGLAGSLFGIVLFMLIKIAENTGKAYFQVFLPVAYIAFAYFLFVFFMNLESQLKEYRNKRAYKLIGIISMSSLEIYYVQIPLIRIIRSLSFPLNWILIVLSTIFSGYLLHVISTWIISVLPKNTLIERKKP